MYVCIYVYPSHFKVCLGMGNGCGMMYCCVAFVCRVLPAEPSTELEPEQKADESFSDEWCEWSL